MLIIPARSKELPADTKSRADQRLALASERRQRMWRLGAAILSICVVVFITFDYVYGQNRTRSTPTEVEAVNGEIRIPLNTVSDGNLHRFILIGHSVRFIVMRTGEKIATALDACQICGSQGYVQEGQSVICLNCSADINPATIGDSGGCNPILLSSINQSGTVVIPVKNLLQEEHRFQSSSHQHE